MKLFIALVLTTSTVAFAKNSPMSAGANLKKNTRTTASNTSTKKFDVRVPIKNWIKKNNKNFRIGIAQGSLGTNVRTRNSAVDNSTNESRNTKFQLQLGWETIKTQEVGYSAYFTYQDIAEAFEDEDVRSMRASGNATWGINNQVYTYGGLNWNKYYGSDQIEGGIDAGLGYQVGLGFKFHKKANVEIEYLTLLNEGRVDGVNVDVESKGIMLKLNTPLTFDI